MELFVETRRNASTTRAPRVHRDQGEEEQEGEELFTIIKKYTTLCPCLVLCTIIFAFPKSKCIALIVFCSPVTVYCAAVVITAAHHCYTASCHLTHDRVRSHIWFPVPQYYTVIWYIMAAFSDWPKSFLFSTLCCKSDEMFLLMEIQMFKEKNECSDNVQIILLRTFKVVL